ncbi:MAG TPA: cytochrome P450 [Acidimicrobiales bacterium]|nr:cytochrome P450 [Acidimicrobiales bacterium]
MPRSLSARPTCDVDVLDRVFYRDPYPVYEWLRAERPIYWDEANELWVLSRHADVAYVSTHPELFCSGRGIRPIGELNLSLAGLDGQRHIQQRRLVNKGFSPRMMRDLEPRIRQITADTLDKLEGRTSCDFLAEVAVPIPMVVIAELMGLPTQDRDRFWHWSDRMVGGEGRTDPADPMLADAGAAFAEYVDYLSGIIEERRAAYRAKAATGAPGPAADDLISVLVAAAEEGIIVSGDEHTDGELSHDELLMFLVLLVVAGNETTRNAIAGGMWAMGRFPEQWRRLVREPTLLETAPDEIVRYVTPVLNFARTATQDTELRGQRISEGDKVLLLYQSANRDEEVFDHAAALRLDRSPNPHLGFGIGPHVCLGMNLARLEIRVVFEELVRRFPDMAVEPGFVPTYGDSLLVHALESLPVRFSGSRS